MDQNNRDKEDFFIDIQRGYFGKNIISKSMQLAAIQDGDAAFFEKNKLQVAQSPFLESRKMSEDAVKNMKYCFVLALADIVQICTENGMLTSEAETLQDFYIRRMDKCRKKEEIRKIYTEACRKFAEQMQKTEKISVISWHIRKCMGYIQENLNCSLSVKRLARLVGLNPSYLSRLFKQEIGISIKQYVIAERMCQAKKLLKDSELSYRDISIALGFSSQSAFIAMFKKTTGITPRHYRMKYHPEA
ncbi:MAG: AraC family transcriptional regulator [Oscillospiraceae bacterium]|nr:AraC family transcriptional regulator [Oscillospiraceae bacterium]